MPLCSRVDHCRIQSIDGQAAYILSGKQHLDRPRFASARCSTGYSVSGGREKRLHNHESLPATFVAPDFSAERNTDERTARMPAREKMARPLTTCRAAM